MSVLQNVIGGVSTVLFNGNPLLRFDAYYMLCDAFDLPSGRPKEYEQLIDKASALLMQPAPDKQALADMYQQLLTALKPTDEFLFRWRAICDKKGWLS